MNLNTRLHQLTYKLFPGRCILCKTLSLRSLDICPACEADLPWLLNCCPYCAEPAPHSLACARCLKTLPLYSAAFSGFEYRFPIDVLIHRFKDSRNLAAGHVLTHLASNHVLPMLAGLCYEDLIITPVPLTRRSRRARGFNQSHLIAHQLASLIPARLSSNLVKKVRDAPAQKTLPLPERRNNLRDSFEVTQRLEGEQVLLVDDVITTGATITEVSRCLLRSGASDVVVFAIARTPPSGTKGQLNLQ